MEQITQDISNSAKPECPFFTKCGGCNIQHISYETQLANKTKMLATLLNQDITQITCVSDKAYAYRNRMDFICYNAGNTIKLGMRKANDWKTIIPITHCAIANPHINTLFTDVCAFFAKQTQLEAFDPRRKTGELRYVVIRATEKEEPTQSSISFVLNQDSTKLSDVTDILTQFARNTIATNVIITYVGKQTDSSISEEFYVLKGTEMLSEKLENKTFLFHTQGFFQNNSDMAAKMLQYVQELLRKYPTTNAHLLDLYGGVGTFGIHNAHLFKSTTIVEDFAGSIDIAKQNIASNNIQNATAICKDAKFLHNVELDSPLFVITDPPRSGMDQKTIQTLLREEPEVIIYISCNPKQMAKELKLLELKYDLVSSAVFDLFPQTNHFEAIVELVKKDR